MAGWVQRHAGSYAEKALHIVENQHGYYPKAYPIRRREPQSGVAIQNLLWFPGLLRYARNDGLGKGLLPGGRIANAVQCFLVPIQIFSDRQCQLLDGRNPT